MATLLFTDETLRTHQPGPHHPESPERLDAVLTALRGADVSLPGSASRDVTTSLPAGGQPGFARPSASLAGSASRDVATSLVPHGSNPRAASVEALRRVHTPGYIDYILGLHGTSRQLDPDTALSSGSVEAARLAAGLSIAAVEAVLRPGARDRAFVAARPPGHHAERDAAMGFCIFNNVAVAAEHARTLGAERVLIVDWDVHHGNGTHHHFYERRDVLFFDAHRYPYYPGSGALEEVGRGEGEGYTINAPLPPGLGDGDYRLILEETLVPVAHAFRPDLILVSAGFDAHRDDPLGDQRVSDDGFAAMAGLVTGLADSLCGGRIAMLLEGGYDLAALGRSVRACVDVLGGSTPPEPRGWSKHAEVLTRAMRKSAARYFEGLRT